MWEGYRVRLFNGECPMCGGVDLIVRDCTYQVDNVTVTLECECGREIDLVFTTAIIVG